MKIYFAVIVLCLPLTMSAMIESVMDTTIHHGGRKYEINDSKDPIEVTVFSKSGDLHEQVYEARFDKGEKVSSRWEVKDIISVPFINDDVLKLLKKKSTTFKFEPHWAGVAFGFCSATNANWQIIRNYAPSGLSIDMARSFEISWNIFNVGFPIFSKNFGIVSGVGLNWRNYVLDGNKRFTKINHYEIGVVPIESGIVDFSRMKTVDLVVPLMLEWQSMNRNNDRFFIMLGAEVCFRTHSSVRTTIQKDGLKQKDFIHGIGSNPVNVDLVCRVGYDRLSLYAKQALYSMYGKGKGPDMRPFSIGFMLSL